MCVCVCAGGINPLLLNSLFGGMDLSSLQSLQSFQLAAGLMAFPPTNDPKQAAASAAAATMLPLMLPGMGGLPNMATALPNMFGLGGLLGGNLATVPTDVSNSATTAASSGNTNGTVEGERKNEVTSKRKREAQRKADSDDCDKVQDEEEEAAANDGKEKKMEDGGAQRAEKPGNDVTTQPQVPAADAPAEASINGDAAALLAAAGMSANSLAFNPFLLSTMAPGLLYPSMFLPPGLGGLSLSGFPTPTTLAELQSAMAGALAGNIATANATRHQEKKGSTEEVEGGGESDLGEEKEEGAEEEVEDGGIVEEEEEAISPLKDKSD